MDAAAVAARIADTGFTVIPDFLTGVELDRATAALDNYFPDPDASNNSSLDVASLKHAVPFPLSDNVLNQVPIDPRVLEVASHLLGTHDLRLTSAFTQAKYGTDFGETHDQSLHNDAWSVNSLVPPRVDGPYQRFFGILYLTDVTEETAPTYVVGRAAAVNAPLMTASGKAAYDRSEFESLYKMERPVLASRGSLLLFVGDIVHRGSAYAAARGRRLAFFFNLHSPAAGWTDKHIWSSRPAAPNWEILATLLAQASPEQRSVLGFPSPDDPYWTEDTVCRVKELYPGMDVGPYERISR